MLEALDAELGRHFFPEDGGGRDPRLCPGCGAGRLSLKLGRFGAFIGCSNYPECRYTRAFGVDSEAGTGAVDTVLGRDPASGQTVSLKKGPYGHYIQLGEAENGQKPKRVALPRGLKPADVDLDRALRLLALPREIGRHPETGEAIVAGLGRFGPYIKHGASFASLAADDDVLTIGLNRAVVLLGEAKSGPRRGPQLLRELGEHPEGGAVGLYRGRYGPYVSHDGVIASLPRGADPDTFSLDQAVEALAVQRAKGKTKRKAKASRPARRPTAAKAPAESGQGDGAPGAGRNPAAAKRTATGRGKPQTRTGATTGAATKPTRRAPKPK